VKVLLFLLVFVGSNLFAIEPDFQDYIFIKQSGENKIGLIQIEREHPIDESTYLYVKFALEHFKKERVSFVALNLNTPGGEVFAAVKIAQLLVKMDSEYHIPVVAFIDNWALSAGAMLAYSCRYIGITSTASMGAAEPVVATGDGGMQTASEKMISALRSEFTNLAKVYGRDPLLAEAMVDKDMLLVVRDGKIVALQDSEQIQESDQVVVLKGKLLTLNAETLLKYGIANFEAASLFSAPFFAAIPEKNIIAYTDWKIDFFAFLSHPAIASLLLIGLILGVYLEMSHPGFGLPGILAISCLSLILLSSFAVQAIHWLEVIILATGILFLLLEIFVIPGFGIVGVLGIILTLGGLFMLTLPSFEGISLNFSGWGFDILLYHLAWFSIGVIASIALICILMHYLPRRKFFLNKFVSKEDQEGFIPCVLNREHIGKFAIALSDLKPSGHISIDGEPFQALSQSKYIYKDSSVIVIGAQGAHYIVILKETEDVSRS
jgi:membrane-bound ClpP family serine protease